MIEDEDLVRKLVAMHNEPVVIDRAEAERRFAALGDKPLVVIGTSGSSDYLRDTGNKRYWPIVVPAEGGEICDGLHDETAPIQYLCSRCFPQMRGDLAETQDDEYEERARNHEEEMD